MNYQAIPQIIRRFVNKGSVIASAHHLSNILTQRLASRAILKISGDNIADYFQGLITNDINHLVDGAPCIYTFFLNNRGRVLYDSIVYRNKFDDSFLIECDKSSAQELNKHLNLFKVRRKINVSYEDNLSVWNVSSQSLILKIFEENATQDESINITKKLLNQLDTYKEITAVADPRAFALGIRIIAPKQIDFSKMVAKCNSSQNYYRELRYKLGIGEGPLELPKENCLPLEANCDFLHGVSFHKGCYIGQELTARTYHTGVIRKRLMPMFFEEDVSDLPLDSVITSENTEKSLGKLRGVRSKFGLGLLRIEEVMKASELAVGGKKFRTTKPFWWPTEAPKGRMNLE